MNRFFSKLDLRDIKIDPRHTSFPPDAEDEVVDDGEPAEVPVDAAPEAQAAAPASVPDDVPDAPSAPPMPDPTRIPAPPVNGIDPGAHVNGTAPAVAIQQGAETERVQRNGEVLKVSARSRPSAVAGAIAGVVREAGRAEVQAIGAGATNQAVKAVAIARDYLRETGIEAICLPAFIDVTIENEDRTAIRLVVEPR